MQHKTWLFLLEQCYSNLEYKFALIFSVLNGRVILYDTVVYIKRKNQFHTVLYSSKYQNLLSKMFCINFMSFHDYKM